MNFYNAIGTLAEFKMDEDWCLYQEHLDGYFLANNIQGDRKVALLITLIGQEAYKILTDLCDPILPAQKEYGDLCELLQAQFSKRVSVYKERIEFYEIRQNEDDNISQWFLRVKNQATNANMVRNSTTW